eukprot:5367035-Alexandrium_andersonii.AAC.1
MCIRDRQRAAQQPRATGGHCPAVQCAPRSAGRGGKCSKKGCRGPASQGRQKGAGHCEGLRKNGD